MSDLEYENKDYSEDDTDLEVVHCQSGRISCVLGLQVRDRSYELNTTRDALIEPPKPTIC